MTSITRIKDIFLNHYYSETINRNNTIFTQHENRMNKVFYSTIKKFLTVEVD
jgi:hypothetical protein